MINESLTIIRHDLSALVSMMVERGHEKATAELVIGADRVCINLHTNGDRAFRWLSSGHQQDFHSGKTFTEAFAAAEKAITERMDDSQDISTARWWSMENYATAAE